MVNFFVIRKYGALSIAGCLPTMGFFIGLTFYGFYMGIGCFLACLGVGIFAAAKLTQNPFSLMTEGKGILVFNMDSTGIIRPFIASLNPPFIKGSFNKESMNDVYDRSSVLSLAPPIKNGTANMEKNKIVIELEEGAFNSSRFGMFHYPVIIYNSQIKSCITKDFLSEQEKLSFAEHGVLYLNRKLEELTSVVRDFGRYVVELTKPKESIFKNKWFITALVVFAIIMVILFAKPILNSLGGIGGSIGSAFGNAASNPVIPRQ